MVIVEEGALPDNKCSQCSPLSNIALHSELS